MNSPTLKDWVSKLSTIAPHEGPHYVMCEWTQSNGTYWFLARYGRNKPGIAKEPGFTSIRDLTAEELAIYQQALILASADK